MNLINNIKIKNKLLLLVVILLVPLIYFLISIIIEKIEYKIGLKSVYEKLEEVEKISSLIHEFQIERALSLSFTSSEGQYFQQALQTQRQKTNIAIKQLEQYLEETNIILPESQLISNLETFRSKVDLLKVDTVEMESFGTNFLERFIGRMKANANIINDEGVRTRLLSFVNILDSKHYLGRLRTLVSKASFTRGLTYKEYSQISTFITLFEKALLDFNSFASEETLNIYQKKINNKNFQETIALLSQINDNPQIELEEENLGNTYNNFTYSIDLLREVENFSLAQMKDAMRSKITTNDTILVFYIAFIMVIIALEVQLSFFIIRSISNSLVVLKEASDKVSLGETDVNVPIYSKDEIGMLAESFRKMVNKNIYFSNIAEEIGNEKFNTIIEVPNDNDRLGNALKLMKEKLEKLSTERENRSWVLSGASELNDIMRGGQEITATSSSIINFITQYLKANVGGIYLIDDYEKLRLTAGYALDVPPESFPEFSLGEGVLGQAALEKRITIIEEVPEYYLRVKSAFSDAKPSQIIIAPIVFENNLVGIIELASLKKFTPLQIEFLNSISEKIAIVIHTIKMYYKTQELLYETQNQAEELETQQEELREINNELKHQKEQLQVSEEELKASQEELQEKNAELEEKNLQLQEQFEALNAKNKEVEEARKAVEIKMRQVESISKYKSEFLANMSHELRTPLNSILILSKLISDNMGSNLSAKQVEQAKIIFKSGNDLLKLINEILDLSKIEAGHIKLEVTEFKLQSIDIAPNFDQIAREKKINFKVTFNSELPETIRSDKFRLEQILKNLLSNAFKFTPNNGEIEIEVFAPSNRSKLRSKALRESKDVIAFAVIDTGIGIPKEKQELIFEAFQQADTSTTRKFGGTGLGLAISRELTTLLGGEMHLESEVDKGSIFTLFLPKHIKSSSELTAEKENHPYEEIKKEKKTQVIPEIENIAKAVSDKKEKTVLIIEDDKGFSNIIADFAKNKKFNALQAFTGNDGFKMAKENIPDAILLDINLPDINGWEVLKKIRNEDDLKGIKVHIMSAYDKENIEEIEDLEEFLPKPITLEMLDKAFFKVNNKGAIQKVLIVEDNQIENNAVSELLLSHHIESASAFSAEEALRKLELEDFDCIILDLSLPGMGGYELMEKIKNNPSIKNIPIVIYSGKELSEEEEVKLKRYANTIIIKNQYSYIRLLDEVQLFLHKVNEKLPGEEKFTMNLHVPEEIMKGKKVLLVDDDVRNVYSLYSILEAQSMNIIIANDGKEALQKLQENKDVAIVLMDIMMPEMDGIEATKKIRQNPYFKSLPIIALTAKAMKGDKEKCIEAGASDYISKPIDVDKLLTLMRVWLYEG